MAREYPHIITSIVPPKPSCRSCGAAVKAFERCPRCGKRALRWPLLSAWVKY